MNPLVTRLSGSLRRGGSRGGGRAARRGTAALAAAALLAATGCATAGSLFRPPEPDVLWTGSAQGTKPGVIVIHDEETFVEATEPLEPDFGSTVPDLDRWTILRVVGRDLGATCGITTLAEVTTSAMRATVVVEEARPAAACGCRGSDAPPPAWMVSVSRAVRRAEFVTKSAELPCDDAQARADATGPRLILEGSWDEEPGASIVRDQAGYERILGRLGVGNRGPSVDFATSNVIAVTGRPRSNGCRRTLAVETGMPGGGELVVTLEEAYPAQGTICTQIFQLPRVFLYRVPKSVESARVVTRETRD